MNISQRSRIAQNLKIAQVHGREIVVTKDTNKVIGFAKNGKFCQEATIENDVRDSKG